MKETHQSRMKIKIFHMAQNNTLQPPLALVSQKHKDVQKNAWGNFCCIFHKESFAKTPLKSDEKYKKVFFFSSKKFIFGYSDLDLLT